MKILKLTWLLILFSTAANAAVLRTIDADIIKSADHTKTYTLAQFPIGVNQAQEVPSGSINSSNTSFTLANTPPANSAVQLFLDGLLLIQGAGLDYTISSATITMIVAPATGQKIYAIYPKY